MALKVSLGTVVIFGGSGFIGTYYAKKLISDGFFVYVIDLVPPRFLDENMIFINQDVRTLNDFDLDADVSHIYNFAAIHTTPGHPTHDYYDTNIAGAISVCEYAELHNINEIVFASSISVYGVGEDAKDEYSALTPNSAYGFSKMLAEKIHVSWNKRCKSSKLTIVRPAVVFGPGEGGNFTRLAAMMSKGFFVYPGRKDTIKACIYIEDLVFAIELARQTDNSYELFNGAYPEQYTLENIVDCFKNNYFPNLKLFTLPKYLVLLIANILHFFNFLNFGIHPDRVLKLIISTNISPQWLIRHNVQLPGNLRSALKRWSKESDGRFD